MIVSRQRSLGLRHGESGPCPPQRRDPASQGDRSQPAEAHPGTFHQEEPRCPKNGPSSVDTLHSPLGIGDRGTAEAWGPRRGHHGVAPAGLLLTMSFPVPTGLRPKPKAK